MTNKMNPRKVAGFSLAAAVLGAFAITPVQAQPVISPSDVTRGINGLDAAIKQFGPQLSNTVEPGSGSTLSRYSSGGWTYTAVAFNPEAQRIYAISTGEGGKPAGHLLRIKPDIDQVADLGPLDLKGIDTKDVASAAFTPDGIYVLFAGPKIRRIDMAKDDLSRSLMSDKVKSTSELSVSTASLTLPDNTGHIGVPSAWASGVDKTKVGELYAISRDADNRFFKWTLQVASGKVAIDPVFVRGGAGFDVIGDLNYAFTKPDGTLVYADDEARTIEVRGTEIVSTYFGNKVEDNFREIAYLPVGAGYRPVTQFEKPAPLPGAVAVPPAGVAGAAGATGVSADELARDLKKVTDAVAGVGNAVGGLPTTTAVVEPSEPTPSAGASGSAGVGAAGASGAAGAGASGAEVGLIEDVPGVDREVTITVADASGHAVAYEPVDIPELGFYPVTDKNGQVRVPVEAADGAVDVSVRGLSYVIRPTATRLNVTVAADGSGTETEAPVVRSAGAEAHQETVTTSTTTTTTTETSPNAPAGDTGTGAGTGGAGDGQGGNGAGGDGSQQQSAARVPERDVDLVVRDDKLSLVNAALITVRDKNGKEVAQERAATDQDGKAVLKIPASLETDSFSVTVTKDGKEKTVDILPSNRKIEIILGPKSTSTSPTTTTTGRKTVTVGVTVKTDAGDPVQNAEVYSVDGLAIRVQGLTDENGLVRVTIPGDVGNGDQVNLGVRTAPSGYRTATQMVSRNVDGATITLPKAATTSTKNTPEQILEVIDQFKPLVNALAAPAALGGALRGTGAKTTATATTGARATISTGRSTTAPNSGGSRQVVSVSNGSTIRTTRASERDDDLADTGTPMQTVITLGILAMLIGGAYIYMGRRRDV